MCIGGSAPVASGKPRRLLAAALPHRMDPEQQDEQRGHERAAADLRHPHQQAADKAADRVQRIYRFHGKAFHLCGDGKAPRNLSALTTTELPWALPKSRLSLGLGNDTNRRRLGNERQ